MTLALTDTGYNILSSAYERAEYDASLDGGLLGEEEGAEGTGEVMQPEMPAGPPGLKKRKARPGRR